MFSSRSKLWKIGDFGTTAEGNSGAVPRRSPRGTACYRAPELIREEPLYTTKADIWALGCILYELATRKRAFVGDWNVDEYAKTKQGPEVHVPTWPKDFQSHLSENVHELLAVDWHQRPFASVVRVTFNSYTRVLDPGIAQPLISHNESLPSYSEWKQLVQLPNQLDLGCRLTEECQEKGDEQAATRVWKDLVAKNCSHQSPEISSQLSLYPTENIITQSQDKGSVDKQETPSDRPSVSLQHWWSFDRWRSEAINEVREDLFSSRTSGIAGQFHSIHGHRRRSSRSGLKAAILVPALLGTSVISAPSTSTERRPDSMLSVEANDSKPSCGGDSDDDTGRPATI